MNTGKKFFDMEMRPDLSSKTVFIPSVDADLSKACSPSNHCTLTTPKPDPVVCQKYNGFTPTDCQNGRIPVSLVDSDGSKALYDQDGCVATFVTHTGDDKATWPLNDSGVIGLSLGSEFLNYVAKNYKLQQKTDHNDTYFFEFSFDYQINNKDARYAADKKDTFALTMWAFGVSKDMMQDPDNLKTITYTITDATDGNWNLPSSTLAVKSANIVDNKKAYITNTENEYFAVDPSVNFGGKVADA